MDGKCICKMISYSATKKKKARSFEKKKDIPGGYHVKQNKPDSERQICLLSYRI